MLGILGVVVRLFNRLVTRTFCWVDLVSLFFLHLRFFAFYYFTLVYTCRFDVLSLGEYMKNELIVRFTSPVLEQCETRVEYLLIGNDSPRPAGLLRDYLPAYVIIPEDRLSLLEARRDGMEMESCRQNVFIIFVSAIQ